MILVLGAYLLMLIFLWCPNCGHRNGAEKTSEHEDHPQVTPVIGAAKLFLIRVQSDQLTIYYSAADG